MKLPATWGAFGGYVKAHNPAKEESEHEKSVRLEFEGQFKDCLDRKDYLTVLKTKELFWIAFCRSFLKDFKEKTTQKCVNGRFLPAVIDYNHYYRSEDDTSSYRPLIEKIRLFVLDAFEKNLLEAFCVGGSSCADSSTYIMDASLVAHLGASDIRLQIIRSNAAEIHRPHTSSQFRGDWFFPCVYSTLNLLGAKIDLKETTCKKNDSSLNGEEIKATTVKLSWPGKKPYKVSPCLVEDVDVLSQKLLKISYDACKNQSSICDLTLEAKDGQKKVNSLMFLALDRLSQEGKSSDVRKEKLTTLDFINYSIKQLEVFIEFLHQGANVEFENGFTGALNLLCLVNSYQNTLLTKECMKVFNREAEKAGLGVQGASSCQPFNMGKLLLEAAYSQEQESPYNDLTLVAEDGAVKVNSLVFSLLESRILQIAVTGPMRSKEGKINLKSYSLVTIKAFVEFLYKAGDAELGTGGFREAVQLFEIACTYQIPSLIAHAVNLINKESSLKDIEEIKEVANFFDNKDLRELVASLEKAK